MAGLKLALLGSFAARWEGKAIHAFDSDMVHALLAFLVVEGDRPHSRERLAELFWSEQPNNASHGDLANALPSEAATTRSLNK